MSTKIIDDLAAQFYLPDQDLLTITHKFLEAFSVGLKEYGHSVAMM
jgi:hypothetical protein